MKVLDFLCPGDWMDSYESRCCNPFNGDVQGRCEIVVESFAHVCNAIRRFNQDKHYWELFGIVYLYLNGSLFGEYNGKELTVYAPSIIDAEKCTIRYPFGDKDIKVAV